jgi:ATP-binding cassette subfamily G (WHITE) protein 2 (SNQ2)
LLTRASVLLLESPINGLDSASALSLLAFLRDWTKTSNRSLVATTPHIADNLFAQFDKVLVLNSTGHQIYFGSINSAQPYFETLGFVRKSATEGIAEFIVNCNEGLDNDLELQGKWESSSERVQLMLEMASYEKRYHYSHCAAPLLAAVEEEKSRFQSNTSPYMINFLPQVVILTRRQYSLIISELPTYVTKTTVNVLLSLLVGTVFFALPPETDAAFTRGGLLLRKSYQTLSDVHFEITLTFPGYDFQSQSCSTRTLVLVNLGKLLKEESLSNGSASMDSSVRVRYLWLELRVICL